MKGGKWRFDCVASTLHATSEHAVSSITTADGAQLGCQQSTELTPPSQPADLNGLVRFAERRNLVSVRLPSHFNWPLQPDRPQMTTAHCILANQGYKHTPRICNTMQYFSTATMVMRTLLYDTWYIPYLPSLIPDLTDHTIAAGCYSYCQGQGWHWGAETHSS